MLSEAKHLNDSRCNALRFLTAFSMTWFCNADRVKFKVIHLVVRQRYSGQRTQHYRPSSPYISSRLNVVPSGHADQSSILSSSGGFSARVGCGAASITSTARCSPGGKSERGGMRMLPSGSTVIVVSIVCISTSFFLVDRTLAFLSFLVATPPKKKEKEIFGGLRPPNPHAERKS